jgi:Uma2 family endonuclease
MLAPAKDHVSVEEYYRMAETGVLDSDARVELIDGKIHDMSPIGPFHGGVTDFLTQVFVLAAKGRWVTRVQKPARLHRFSEPQPDLMLLKPSSNFYRRRHPQPEDVFLLVEISDSSLDKDQNIKLPAYARAGIAEVWIVDLNDQTIEVYRQPNVTGYAEKIILREGEEASPPSFPDAVVDVAEWLKR